MLKVTLKQIYTKAFAGLLLLAPVFANADAQDVESRLKTAFPKTSFTSVSDSPIPGLYQVVMGKNVAFTDATARYMLFGHIWDMKEQKDLTAAVAESSDKIELKSLPLNHAIKTVIGNGKSNIVVFLDPDCPYCKQLQPRLDRLNNVTIYTFLYPLASIHPNAIRDSINIWCSKDQTKALDDMMIGGIESSETAKCSNPIEDNVTLGTRLNIAGTPTMIFEDGTTEAGALPLTEINKHIQLVSSK